MDLAVGEITQGVVTGLAKFGAFVKISDELSGLVHISELSNSYVNRVEDVLSVGDNVTVKVLSNEDGKLNLSIKQALPEEEVEVFENEPEFDDAFEAKLKKFLKVSQEKLESKRSRENFKSNGYRKR
ncbi:S1 RNA-binding domain-containing protein [Peptoniphilus sp. GNH]|nr:S1 RNA binding domain protein [Clostridiales bacterium KA00134]UHR02721.1 S1 RNA-binding domain-containing protein [Peptoniphilus sp. GNH]